MAVESYDLSLMFQSLFPRLHSTTGLPDKAAQKVGDLAMDADKNIYFASATSATSDWKMVGQITLVPSAGTTARKTLAGPYTQTTASYVKVAEITIPSAYASGTFTTTFSMAHSGTTQPVYGRLYKNGQALGTEQSIDKDTPGPTAKAEDLALAGGDVLQLYAKRGSDATDVVTLTDFIVKCTNTATLTTINPTW